MSSDLALPLTAALSAHALLAAAAIGLVEEGAKLAGILLVVERGLHPRVIAAAAVGVAAGFSSLEAILVLDGGLSALTLARAALGPVSHGLLAVPLALGTVAWTRRAGRLAFGLPVALAASAALHGAGDLALALPRGGRTATPRRSSRRRCSSSHGRGPGNERVRSTGGPCVRTRSDRSSVHRREAGFASDGFMPTSTPFVNPPGSSPPGLAAAARSLVAPPRWGSSRLRMAPATSW